MISHQALIGHLRKKDNVQIVIKELTPFTGKIKEMDEEILILEPYTDKELIEMYGEPVSATTYVPYNEIMLIFNLDSHESKDKDSKDSN